MTNLKTPKLKPIAVLLLTAGFALAGTAHAGDDAFAASDANADGALDGGEFITFVSVKAEAGDEQYAAIRESGDYDTPFKTLDVNADGLLDTGELGMTASE
jgi:Ca2+-binding EF-hand superfamily protein